MRRAARARGDGRRSGGSGIGASRAGTCRPLCSRPCTRGATALRAPRMRARGTFATLYEGSSLLMRLRLGYRYVLPNHYVFQLAQRPPPDLPGLLSIFQLVPPLVRTRSLELLDVVKDAVKRAASVQEITVESMSAPAPTARTDELRVAGSGVGPAGLWDRSRREFGMHRPDGC